MNLHVYIVNVLVSVGVIIFCAFKIMTDNRPETTSIYLPILSAVLGWYVPNPSLKKKEEKIITPQMNNNSTSSNYSNQQTPPLSPATINIDIPNRINNI